MPETLGREERQALAAKLWQAACTLGRSIAEIEELELTDLPTIQAEPEAADKIVIDGPEVARALRTLAMRLDRAVLVKMSKSD